MHWPAPLTESTATWRSYSPLSPRGRPGGGGGGPATGRLCVFLVCSCFTAASAAAPCAAAVAACGGGGEAVNKAWVCLDLKFCMQTSHPLALASVTVAGVSFSPLGLRLGGTRASLKFEVQHTPRTPTFQPYSRLQTPQLTSPRAPARTQDQAAGQLSPPPSSSAAPRGTPRAKSTPAPHLISLIPNPISGASRPAFNHPAKRGDDRTSFRMDRTSFRHPSRLLW